MQDEESIKKWGFFGIAFEKSKARLRASDLLNLKVRDITYRDGSIRRKWRRKQQKNKRGVFPALTPETADYVKHWLTVSGKQPSDYVFTRFKPVNGRPITRAWYAVLVKDWAELLGHPREDYSTHSMRRSKPIHLYQQGERVADLSKMLGHKTEAATLDYLGITQKRAEAVTLRHRLVPAGLLPAQTTKTTPKK